MAKKRLFNRNHTQDSRELGFGTTDARQQRLINRDGTYNYIRIGAPFYETFNVYHFLVSISWIKLILLIIAWYTLFNFIFVGLYYLIGIEQITGMMYSDARSKFWEVYFFSAQTLTTVGYGRINPMGFEASAISSLEALTGLMSFALITGLLFARFAKAPAKLMFSKQAVIAPFTWKKQEITAFMFRSVNQYNTNLLNMKANVNLIIVEEDDDGNENRRFYGLPLERDTISFFPSSWTIVHPIDENSPLYGFNKTDFEKTKIEFMIMLSGFDETFDQNVFMRYSYNEKDIEWGAKYIKLINYNEQNAVTVDLSKLSTVEKMPIDHLLPKFEEKV